MNTQEIFKKYRKLHDKRLNQSNCLVFSLSLQDTINKAIAYCKANKCTVISFQSTIHNYDGYRVDVCKGFKVRGRNKFFMCGNGWLTGNHAYEIMSVNGQDPAILVNDKL